MHSNASSWPIDRICLRPPSIDVAEIAVDLYQETCRFDFDAPGFCVLNVGPTKDSHAFRQLMVDLKHEMEAIHKLRTGHSLVYLSAARFDQQTSTKPHLDGGPDECFLMLGYEPSGVDSQLEFSDYAKCAFDLGLTPKEFMIRHNPMFQSGYDLLRPYTTRVPCFSRTDYQVVCVNNSSAAYSETVPAWQGVLHTATIAAPDESARRVINSTMIASAVTGTAETIAEPQQLEFIQTTVIRRRGYDNLHLEDDQ